MWISRLSDWDSKHTDLTKFFIEKVKQRVDYDEIISNRHRTTNGLTLIEELVKVIELTLKRKKSLNRLNSILAEMIDKDLSSSIINDFIIIKYHSDIIQFYKNVNSTKLAIESKNFTELQLKSKIFLDRLTKDYFSKIKLEIGEIDFESNNFETHAKNIDRLIDLLIPYLLHVGYSATSISDIAYRLIRKSYGKEIPKRFLSNFNGKKVNYDFLIVSKSDYSEFCSLLSYLDKKDIKYDTVNITNFNLLKKNTNLSLSKEEYVYEFKYNTIDPHNFLRNIYDKSLKNHVYSKDRLSLAFFNDYFDKIYWRFSKGSHKYQLSNNKADPINIKQRKNTLFQTLKLFGPENKIKIDESLPMIESIQDSVYFYNLALGSKSIENSISLLWTSLESLVPYRFHQTDIENVQHFVSKSLAVGAFGRDICSFVFRLIECAGVNPIDFAKIKIEPKIYFTPRGLKKWIDWLSDGSTYETDNDPYKVFKPISNLLCGQFCNLSHIYAGVGDNPLKVEHLYQRIISSKKSIEYQIDRIYLHRNQIVHSGKFINEYSNVWMHLEWYVGKLIAYFMIKALTAIEGDEVSKEGVFMELEGDCDYIINYLKRNKDKNVSEINFEFDKMFSHTWQYF